jgi:hypothetical protein
MHRQPIATVFFLLALRLVSLTSAYADLPTPEVAVENRTPPWKGGKAEITSYSLEQARYGAMHSGYAVLIFVEEPFSASKHVKLDDWQNAGQDRVDVLKLNLTKHFLTGVYPYSMMLSVFTPVDIKAHPRTLKTTATIQEWCGMTFGQMNLRGGKFASTGFSYFESDGDTQDRIEAGWLEDELWTKIRLEPGALPEGEVQIIPGAFHARFHHRPQRPVKAHGSWIEGEAERTYVVEFREAPKRTLQITIEAAWPYLITGWTETTHASEGSKITTRAVRRKTLLLDYWNRNGVADRALREQLDLPVDH